jgi:SAM-dependent methyltransferase
MMSAQSSLFGLVTRSAACPLCGGTQFEPLARHDRHLLGLHTVGCRSCGLPQTHPRPTQASLDDFYVNHYRSFYQGVTQPNEGYVASLSKDVRLRYTVDFLSDALQLANLRSLLDYGCGEGSLFVALRKGGFGGELLGVEANREFSRFAAEQGRASVHPHLSAVGRTDAVVVNHVLEHIADPVELLRRLGEHLDEGGLLYVDVPDAEEYDSVSDLHIAHLYHFTERTLARAVEQAGYSVLRCEKHRPPHHPRSVRLLASRGGAPAALTATSPPTERLAWDRIRRIERSAWRWVARRRLASVPWLKRMYRHLKGRRAAAKLPPGATTP